MPTGSIIFGDIDVLVVVTSLRDVVGGSFFVDVGFVEDVLLGGDHWLFVGEVVANWHCRLPVDGAGFDAGDHRLPHNGLLLVD